MNKNKNKNKLDRKPLAIHCETVRILETRELSQVAGGQVNRSLPTLQCDSAITFC